MPCIFPSLAEKIDFSVSLTKHDWEFIVFLIPMQMCLPNSYTRLFISTDNIKWTQSPGWNFKSLLKYAITESKKKLIWKGTIQNNLIFQLSLLSVPLQREAQEAGGLLSSNIKHQNTSESPPKLKRPCWKHQHGTLYNQFLTQWDKN